MEHRQKRRERGPERPQPEPAQVRMVQLIRERAADPAAVREPAMVIETGDVRISIGPHADAGLVVLALAVLGARR